MRQIPHESHSLKLFGQSQHQAFAPGKTYQAMSWNIFKSKRKGWQHDFARLHPMYDLLLLQEAKINFNQNIDHYDPDYSWLFGESFLLNRCGSSCGVLTGSRIHHDSAFNLHGPVPEPILKTPKSTAFAYYPVADRDSQMLVINSHFINFRQTLAFQRQLHQVLEVIDLHTGPILFAGDFNTWNARRRRMLMEALSEHGLQHVAFPDDPRNFLTLDYIFVRGLKISRAELLKDIISSDHKPLSVAFEIPLLNQDQKQLILPDSQKLNHP
ncbi:MAG: endonuclease/exonuclease/phosphatase family protein [Candidatus Sericytochromatia bacterium]|nr:endonuclease/exonuclease/phosphatase family protein [Candidatus Sericytochromatia bacterium]